MSLLLRFVITSRNLINDSHSKRYIPWKHIFRPKKLFKENNIKENLNVKKYLKVKLNKDKVINKIGGFAIGLSSGLILKLFTKSNAFGIEVDQSEIHQSNESDWQILLKYLIPFLWQLLIAISSAFIVAILNIWIPQCVGQIVNIITKFKFNEHENFSTIFQQLSGPAFQLARMYLFQALFTFSYIYSLSSVGERVAMKLRQDIFNSIIMQDIEFFDKNRSGEIINRLSVDVQDFKSCFKILISQGLRSLTQTIGCVMSVIIISPQLTGLMILFMPTVIIIGTLIGRSLRKLSNEAQNQIAKSTAVCEEAVQNIRTVRSFAAEEKEMLLFNEEVEKAANLYQHLGFEIGLFQAGTNLFLNGILFSTLYFGGHLISTGQLSPGDLMAFLLATQTIQRSLTQISMLFGTYVRGASAATRIFEYLRMKPSPMMIGGMEIKDKSLNSTIDFKNVSFHYPTRPEVQVLQDFNLKIPAGCSMGIVGSSGSGKTTIGILLERMYDVTDGKIEIDGTDIKTLNSSDLRGKILGYIEQEPVLFSKNIMENIRYGKSDASDEEVIQVSKKANAHNFIQSFPEGYQTLVGERGAQLSGGQKQRIAIARALLKNPSILILDEATSALDYESERAVQTALDVATRDRTVIIIAHRLSTVKNADIIVVLKRGAIVEMGTHASLIEKRGAYYELVKREETEE